MSDDSLTRGDAVEDRPETSEVPDDPESAAQADARGFDTADFLDVPRHIRQAARETPDSYLPVVDPAWAGEGEPPEWAVVGVWQSGPDGEVVRWHENPDHRPSPELLGWSAPTDDVDEAVQLASSGYGSDEQVVHSLALAEVAVLLTPDGRPAALRTEDGQAVVPVYTSGTHLRAAGPLAGMVVAVPELVDLLPAEHWIHLNPTAEVSMTLDPDLIREFIADVAEVREVEVPTPDAVSIPRPAPEPEPGPDPAQDLVLDPVPPRTESTTGYRSPEPVAVQDPVAESSPDDRIFEAMTGGTGQSGA